MNGHLGGRGDGGGFVVALFPGAVGDGANGGRALALVAGQQKIEKIRIDIDAYASHRDLHRRPDGALPLRQAGQYALALAQQLELLCLDPAFQAAGKAETEGDR